MKKYIAFSYSLILLACNNSSVSNSEKQTSTVKNNFKGIDQVIDSQLIAWNNGDMLGFMQGYWHSDSLSFVTRNGERKSWDTVYAKYAKAYDTKAKMGNLSFDIFNKQYLNKQEDMAQVFGMYHVRKEDLSHDSGYFSLIFKQLEKKEWKIIIDHTF